MAVKKVAKKTYPAVKKIILPRLKKRMTVEELAAVMAENHAKTEAVVARTSANVDELTVNVNELSKHVDDVSKHVDELTVNVNEVSKHVDELTVNVNEVSKHVDDLTDNVNELSKHVDELTVNVNEVSKHVDELTGNVNEVSKNVNRLSKMVGDAGNNIGSIVEFVVIPHIRKSINAAGGHSFTNTKADTTIRDTVNDVKKDVAQMDVFLYNDTEAMAIEVKTDLHVGDVNDHLIRLRKLRKHGDKIDIARKKLFGAVAGIIVDDRAEKYALEKGLYVVKIQEDEELLEIEKPESCRAW